MTTNPQTSAQIETAIARSGVLQAYTSFNRDKVIKRMREGKAGFIEEYEDLVDIRNAEVAFYQEMGAKDYDREKKEAAAKIRKKYQPILERHLRKTLPFSYAVVDFARQIIGETPAPKGEIGVPEYIREQVEAHPVEVDKAFFEEVEKALTKIAKNDVHALTLTPSMLPALSEERMATILELEDPAERSAEAQSLAFEIFAHSAHPKTPEDMERLVKLWPGNAPQQSQAETAREEAQAAREEKPSNFWQNRVLQGGAGVALMVAPSLLPPEKSEKLTFGKVLRTTFAVLAPLAGMVLLSYAMMPHAAREQLRQETRSQGAGFSKN